MSYGIIRVQKFKSSGVKGIQLHDKREKGLSHTNKDIDWDKAILNYNLDPVDNNNFTAAVKEKINSLNLKRAVRKDAVVMAQVLVTSDHEFFKNISEKEQKKFFQDSYEYLKNNYGEENIISAIVHLDETTPHMHFNFVPITDDKRLSAKDVITRTKLRKQQTTFYEEVGSKYGLERGVPGGKKKHLEVLDYKLKVKQEEFDKLEKKINIDKSVAISIKKIDKIEVKENIFTDKDKVKISKKDFNHLKKAAKEGEKHKAENLIIAESKEEIKKYKNELNKKLKDASEAEKIYIELYNKQLNVNDEVKELKIICDEREENINALTTKLNEYEKIVKVVKADPEFEKIVNYKIENNNIEKPSVINQLRINKIKNTHEL